MLDKCDIYYIDIFVWSENFAFVGGYESKNVFSFVNCLLYWIAWNY